MAVTSEPDNTPLPGTVFTPRQVRKLKIAVIVMGILLVGGFVFVVATIGYQASRLGRAGGGTPVAAVQTGSEIEFAVPEDAAVTALDLDGGRLALHLTTNAGPEIAVIDLTTGKIVSRIKLKPN